MAIISEVRHTRNVSNFNNLISFVETYGNAYNPTKQALQLPQLYTISIIAQDKLTCATIQKTAYNNAVNTRKEAFYGLQELTARVVNILEAGDISGEKIHEAKEYLRQIHGIKASNEPISPEPIKLSYDQAVQLFAGLISIAETEKSYAPKETELSVAGLKAMLEWLTQQNTAKSLAYNAIRNVRTERNKVLYHPETGLLAVAEDVKKYILSVFGHNSPQFKQVNRIKFKKPKM